MDIWRYFDITHRDHLICNPTSAARLDELIGWLDLPDEPRVLDLACGKGEFLLRLAEACGSHGRRFHGVGVEISPFHVAELRTAAAQRAPEADLEILEMDAADYRPEQPAFDLASSLGASWIHGGHRGTLRALRLFVRPGGQVLVGEPFWQREPDPAYLEAADVTRDMFGSHEQNVVTGEEEGLVPLLAFVSSGEDWDRYETLQWRAVARFAADNPDDRDLPELLERQTRARHAFLAWGRETLGWAMYLFGRPGTDAPS